MALEGVLMMDSWKPANGRVLMVQHRIDINERVGWGTVNNEVSIVGD
jgi:hypothetical protein